jgi:hypothetical protein
MFVSWLFLLALCVKLYFHSHGTDWTNRCCNLEYFIYFMPSFCASDINIAFIILCVLPSWGAMVCQKEEGPGNLYLRPITEISLTDKSLQCLNKGKWEGQGMWSRLGGRGTANTKFWFDRNDMKSFRDRNEDDLRLSLLNDYLRYRSYVTTNGRVIRQVKICYLFHPTHYPSHDSWSSGGESNPESSKREALLPFTKSSVRYIGGLCKWGLGT